MKELKGKIRKQNNVLPIYYKCGYTVYWWIRHFLWLSSGDLKGEIESEIMAAQDQQLQTKSRATKILQTTTDSKRRM